MEIKPGNDWWQGRREEQQDAFGFVGFDQPGLRTHGGVLMVLADGMGGMSGGREASRAAVEHFMAAYSQKTAQEDIPAALERALLAANRAVYELALSREGEGEVGTTLVAAVVHQDEAHWISVGDSRLYLYQADGDTLTLCTEDHTQGNELLELVARGELTRAEAEADPDYQALVSFLGLRQIPKIDRSVRPRRLALGDRLLLVSDGVYGTLAERDIAMLLRDDAQPAAEALLRAVKDRAGPSQDNATATVIALGDALPPTRSARVGTPEPVPGGTWQPSSQRGRAGAGLQSLVWRNRLFWPAVAVVLLLLVVAIGFYLAVDKPGPELAAGAGGSATDDPTQPDPDRETFYVDEPNQQSAQGAAEADMEVPQASVVKTPDQAAEQAQQQTPAQLEHLPKGQMPPQTYSAPGHVMPGTGHRSKPGSVPIEPQPVPRSGQVPTPQTSPPAPQPSSKASETPRGAQQSGAKTSPAAAPPEQDLAPVEDRRPVQQGKALAGEDGPAADAKQEKRGWLQRIFGRGKDTKDGQGDSNGSDGTDSPFLQGR